MLVQAAAYWGPAEGPQGKDAEVAVAATWDLISQLTGTTTWFRRGDREPALTQSDIPVLLDEGRNRDDGTGEVIESLGRRLAITAGSEAELLVAVDGEDPVWRGVCVIEHPGLPATADGAWPLLDELIRIWRPRHATVTTDDLRMVGRRHGLGAGLPRLGMLTWIRDGVESPFTGGDTTHVHGGTLYRFGECLEDITEEVAGALLPSAAHCGPGTTQPLEVLP